MKNKIIKFCKIFFGTCLILSILVGVSIMCYMIAFHARESVISWPKTNKTIEICVGSACFSGIWLLGIDLIIDKV
jgi:hypothetical protein